MKTRIRTRYFRKNTVKEDVSFAGTGHCVVRESPGCKWHEAGAGWHECKENDPEAALDAFMNKVGRQAIIAVNFLAVVYECPDEL